MKYLLDANVFMSAKRVHYGFDFCPGFWDWLVKKNDQDIVFSIEKVYDEISAGGDDLSRWARERKDTLFLQPPKNLSKAFERISNELDSKQYGQIAINDFLQTADYFLIAHALTGGYTVVTYEVPSGSTKKVKIPDMCISLEIPCATPHQILRKEKARFVLKRQVP